MYAYYNIYYHQNGIYFTYCGNLSHVPHFPQDEESVLSRHEQGETMSQPPNYPNGQQPNNQSGFYNQPTSQYRQPGQLLPCRPPSPNKKPDHSQRNAWIIIGAILVLGLLIGTIVSATQGTQTPTAQA